MGDFKIVIDSKEYPCAKCDKVYVELDNSIEMDNIDYTGLENFIESFNIPREPISCTMHIKKKNHNYKRMCKFFKKLIKEFNQSEN
jgi:hypothetical protein